MAYLFNIKTRSVEDIPENELAKKIQSGTHEHIAGKEIQVVSPEGKFGTVDSLGVKDALDSGFKLATTADRQAFTARQQQKEKLDIAAESPLMAAGLGVARGATFGASDVIGRAFGQEENINLLKEANPIASTLGEVGGALATSFTAPGVGLSRLAAKAGTAAIEKTGLAAGVQAALKGAESGGKLAKLGAGAAETGVTALKQGIAGAVEGAAYGAGMGVSEAALGDPNEVAEHLFMETGIGALAGGVAGAGIPLVIKGIGSLMKGGLSASSAAANQFGKSILKPRLDDEAQKTVDRVLADPKAYEKFNGAAAEQVKIADLEAQKGINHIKKNITAEIDKATDPTELIEKANFAKTEIDRIKQGIIDEDNLIIADFRGRDNLNTITRIAETEAIPEVERILGILEKKGLGKTDELADILAEAKTKIQTSTTEGVYDAAEDINTLRQIRRGIDENINWGKEAVNDPKTEKYLKSLRASIDDKIKNFEVEELRDAFSAQDAHWSAFYEKLQKPFKGNFMYKRATDKQWDVNENKVAKIITSRLDNERKALKQVFEEFGTYNQNLPKSAQASQRTLDALNSMVDTHTQSLIKKAEAQGKQDIVSDIMLADSSNMDKYTRIRKELGLPGDDFSVLAQVSKELDALEKLKKASTNISTLSTIGGTTLGAAGIPFPIALAASGAVSAAFNPYGTLKIISMLKNASEKANNRITKGVAKMSENVAKKSRSGVIVPSITSGSSRDWKNDQEYYASMRDPMVVTQVVQKATEGFAETPAIQQAVQDKLTTGYMHLADTLPTPVTSPADRISPKTANNLPSKADLTKWYKRKDVIENPQAFLDRIENGEMPTVEEVDTFKMVFPTMFGKLKDSVNEALIASDVTIPYKKRALMSRIFGQSRDLQTDPQYAQALQKNLYEPEEGQEGGSSGGAVGSGTVSSRIVDMKRTSMDRLLSRRDV